MDCAHYDAARCRSCSLLEVPRPRQVADKVAHVQGLVPATAWMDPVVGPEAAFRNKAKMVVAGTVDSPTLGILSPTGDGVDLRDCGLHLPGITATLPAVADFVTRAALAPYDVATRRGELKHVLLTEAPGGDQMLRFVLRSTEAETRIRKHLPALRAQVPALRVVSLNILPEHKAVLEGDREIVLTDETALPMQVNGLTLHLRPQSFFQTNTEIAAALYRHARDWAADLPVHEVWDLYCGVGGFALHLARPGRRVTGVEVSREAVASAARSATAAGLPASFVAADATSYVHAQPDPPDLVVVNPPRRGIGTELAEWLERSGVEHVLYSSCRAESLAHDLAAMPSLRPVRGVLLDMFPHTPHYEVLVQLAR